ncbi:hypothetical protein LWI28_014116 [Acer negundo]|uniref:Uncharacterized protein n=1 Tax=Acer negundo TaxID=4023 RepID=A0AAD5NJN6_ACENE|nr:hypothetical protein LWI28_014116 [Acer negundo]KAK4837185.1 hypothetical protein QYF36_003474 [Acer negundo]
MDIRNVSGRALCVKGCGFYCSEETKNKCSTCYNHFLKTQHLIDETLKALESLSLADTNPSSVFSVSDTVMVALENLSLADTKLLPSNPSSVSSSDTAMLELDSGLKTSNALGFGLDSSGSRSKSRCNKCNKKVGLIGFKCRCGDLFCGKHRYATEHSCTFDYKKFDLENLMKQNPLINRDKLAERI